MEILFATHNESKLKSYQNYFIGTNYELISLDHLNVNYDVIEDGNNPRENSIKKAVEYSNITGKITIAEDTGLYFDDIEDNKQPGINVRRINGKKLSDEELLKHYLKIIKSAGGTLNGRWQKSLTIVFPNKEIYSVEYNTKKIFIDKVNEKENPGYPLDSISICPDYNKYTVDLTHNENIEIFKKNNEKIFNYIIKVLNKHTKIKNFKNRKNKL